MQRESTPIHITVKLRRLYYGSEPWEKTSWQPRHPQPNPFVRACSISLSPALVVESCAARPKLRRCVIHCAFFDYMTWNEYFKLAVPWSVCSFVLQRWCADEKGFSISLLRICVSRCGRMRSVQRSVSEPFFEWPSHCYHAVVNLYFMQTPYTEMCDCHGKLFLSTLVYLRELLVTLPNAAVSERWRTLDATRLHHTTYLARFKVCNATYVVWFLEVKTSVAWQNFRFVSETFHRLWLTLECQRWVAWKLGRTSTRSSPGSTRSSWKNTEPRTILDCSCKSHYRTTYPTHVGSVDTSKNYR